MLKRKKKSSKSSSIEVKVDIPITGTSLMAVLLICLLALVGYSGYLGVKSIWKFTHPRFEISTDTFKALTYAAKNTTIPSFSIPPLLGEDAPDATSKTNYLEALRVFKKDFATQFPNSPLLRIPDAALLQMGWSFCEAKKKSIAETGKYSEEEIITEHQSKFVLKYVNLAGLEVYLSGIGRTAFSSLCGEV